MITRRGSTAVLDEFVTRLFGGGKIVVGDGDQSLMIPLGGPPPGCRARNLQILVTYFQAFQAPAASGDKSAKPDGRYLQG
ncbi:hypothetical protein [Actinomadura sp. NPDC048394]|jgi:hypothetical protein|uniref:hypothetical protein n=1 Tax=Actinomadura sp. NPDC048394 TaxID=3158223 RepID=UPI0033E3B31F